MKNLLAERFPVLGALWHWAQLKFPLAVRELKYVLLDAAVILIGSAVFMVIWYIFFVLHPKWTH